MRPLATALAVTLTIAAAVACGACGARGTSTNATDPHGGVAWTAEPPLLGGDAGLRVCTPESKDLGPCLEDCTRKVAYGCAHAASRLERDRGENGRPADATFIVSLRERACEFGDGPSCARAARMHAAGEGVPPSRARQMDLLGRACVAGETSACSVAAKAFSRGLGVPRDERRARELWQTACGAGEEQACTSLGDAGL